MSEINRGLFINGAFRDGSEGKTLDVLNPANNQLLASVAVASIEDVNQAVEGARAAFDQGGWGVAKPKERARFLRRIADGIRKNLEDLAALESKNVGKPIGDSRWEVNAGAELFDYYAGAILIHGGEMPPVSAPGIDLTFRQPIGVVTCIVPWNFPFLMTCAKVAPAIAAGNATLLKPASYTPLSALGLAGVAQEAELPAGVLQVLVGPGGTVGNAMVEHPLVGKISFTGETTTGTEIMKKAAEKIGRISLELGGKSPNIVTQDADVAKAASSSPMSVFANTGQDCCARSRAFVHQSVLDDFVNGFIEATKNLKIGDPLDDQTEVGPMISKNQRQISLDYIALGKEEGASLAYGGTIPSDPSMVDGNYLIPAVLVDVKNTMRVAQEEIFGPVLCVIPYKDEATMIREVNDCRYGLSGSIWSENLSRAIRIAKAVESGNLSVNCNSSVFNEAPFGGFKQSGIGRERGLYALEAFTEVKNVFLSIDSQFQS
ncbi:MAG: aldehyde dehydrogenase [Candidatus Omnitrophica bacterium]|nr:aldehyde dehydrogenase [Candidatus Omnitrophota bacterium]